MMRAFAGIATAILLGAAASGAAGARDLAADEMAALEQTIADFMDATRQADADGVLAVMPPAVIEHIADSNGLTVEALKVAVKGQVEAIAAGMAGSSFDMDIAAAEHRELADGTPYLVVPTTTGMPVTDAATTVAHTSTLAFMDEGAWYLVRIADTTQLAMLVAAYPEFAGVEFPEAWTETQSP